MSEEMSSKGLSRRSFLTGAAGVGALAAVTGLVGCGGGNAKAETSAAPAATDAADGAPSWLGSAPSIKDSDCKETVDTDVLVIGAGCSGLFAAVSAAEAGAKVCLIEGQEKGFGIRGSALGAIDSNLQQAEGITIDKMDIINDIARYADNQCDMRLWKVWADESGEAISWYVNHVANIDGVNVNLEWSMPEGTRYANWPTGHGTDSDSPEVRSEDATYEYFTKLLTTFPGCELRNFTKLEALIKEGDKVVGAYAAIGEQGADGYIRINAAKGVVVATGGYLLNKEMMTALQPDTLEVCSGIFTRSYVQGDGIKAAMWAGADMEPTHCSLIFDRGNITPDVEVGTPYDTNGRFYNFSSQPWLKVNVDGQRFCNESSPYDYVAHAAASGSRNKAWYPVWDANYLEDIQRFYTVGCSTQWERPGGDVTGTTLDDVTAGVDKHVEDGLVIKADTLEELAKGLGIDAENFKKTVERYNAIYDAQVDDDFGKEPFRLSAMKTAPFYGMKMGGLLLCTFDGIRVNEECQAQGADGMPIEGLYIVGNDAGNLYHKSYPNFAAGLNAGRCATQGRHVGLALAAK